MFHKKSLKKKTTYGLIFFFFFNLTIVRNFFFSINVKLGNCRIYIFFVIINNNNILLYCTIHYTVPFKSCLVPKLSYFWGVSRLSILFYHHNSNSTTDDHRAVIYKYVKENMFVCVLACDQTLNGAFRYYYFFIIAKLQWCIPLLLLLKKN